MLDQNSVIETLKISLHMEKQATFYFYGFTVNSFNPSALVRSFRSSLI
jgi:hypothetical protein